MFNSRIIYAVILLFFCAPAVFAQGSGTSDGSDMGLFADFGFGFANNLRLSDWMNRMAELQELSLGNKEDESTRKEPLFYGGIDIEGMFFTGNIVLGPSFGYYDVSQGYREVTNNTNTLTYKQRVSLSFIACKASIYYMISFAEGNFLLLGGGLGYYKGTLKNEYENVFGTPNKYSSEDSAWTIGIHTGLEYNIRFFDSFVFSAGFVNRFAEALTLDVDVNNNDDDDKINAGLVGIYLYVGCGYMI